MSTMEVDKSGWMLDAVQEFHRSFGHPVGAFPKALDLDRLKRRVSWLQEEVDELSKAQSLVDQVDALADIIYFAFGTFVELGVRPEVVFKAVHEANMAKLGTDGKPVLKPDGKIGKPAGWIGPEQKIEAEIVKSAMSNFIGRPADDYSLFVAHDGDCLEACIVAAVARLREQTSVELEELKADIASPKKAPGTAASDLEVGLPVNTVRWNALESVTKMSLQFSYLRANTFPDWELGDVLRRCWDEGSVAIATLSAAKLFNHRRADLGHAVILTHLEKDRVIYLDLAEDHFGHFELSLDDLYVACRAREGGILSVSVFPCVDDRVPDRT